ncbi:MAG: stage II sporulation protein M [Gammaproteobacteria bacterium]|nr:MAG: stage II sporulation protein M [Gammaproteobacteria bacterium]
MKQQTFERLHAKFWDDFESMLEVYNKKGTSSGYSANYSHERFINDYRLICQHYSLSKSRAYSNNLIGRLHSLAMGGHQVLYKRDNIPLGRILHFITTEFPCAVRREYKLMIVSILLFFGVMFASASLIVAKPDLAYSVVSEYQLKGIENMYDPGERKNIGRKRDSDSDILMFGFYIRNNTGIGLGTFASGIIFGVGTIFILLFNAIFIGVISGHIINVGFIDTFFPFVVGHGSFELTAIALAGCAGLKLGMALLNPGRYSRFDSVKRSALHIMPIVIGMMGMFIIAAFIEAFWSSSTFLSNETKYITGAILWTFVIIYFLFSGRGRAHR